MARELDPLVAADPVAPDRERPRGGDPGVELADRAGGRVAGVCERGLPGRGALLVELGERAARKVDLAADLDSLGRVVDPQWDRPDRAQVLGDVLADHAVAASRPANELAALVEQRDRDPVDLRLGDEAQLPGADVELAQPVVQARLPGPELVRAAGVAQREHRLQVANRLERVDRLAAHPLGRRIRAAQLGVLRLEGPELVEQRVVFVVADLGIVEDVVAMVVAGDLAAKLLRPLGRILGAHPAPVIAASSIPSRSQSRSRPRPSRSVRSKCTGVIAIRPRATAARSVPGSSSKEGSKP